MRGISLHKLNTTPEPVKGVVKDETGLPIPGVSVKIKGTTQGTQTGIDGQYTIDANTGDVLVFSFVGYLSKEVTVGTGDTQNVVLTPDTKNLNEVVVTALGITKTSESLTYDQQTVSGKQLQVAKDPSFVNSLTGKVAGLDISESSSGAGGSTKVVLRGDKSIAGNNNVLYVVDGIPLNENTTGQPNGPFAYAPDGGDGISNLNPDDIESISILKGASASALYGSQAANGVILITTKKGRAGKAQIDFSSNTMFQTPFSLPKFQNEYGQGDTVTTANPNSLSAWGPRQSGGFYNVKDFFNTGNQLINSLSLSTGTEKDQIYASYSNTHADGIEPGNTFYKNNFTLRNTAKILNDKVTVDASANYIDQKTVNRPTSGTYFNPLFGLYLFPRGADFAQYKNFEVYDPGRTLMVQNWPATFQSGPFTDNPYWVQNRDATTMGLNRFLGSLSAKYDIADWINFQVRGKVDKTNFVNDQKIYATSISILSGPEGSYDYGQSTNTQVYSDALLNINKKVGSFNLTGTFGASIQDNQSYSNGFAGYLQTIDNYFNASNLDKTNTTFTQNNTTEEQTQSLFFSAEAGYKDMLFLDVTGRNDWSSALAFTPHESFFYPSFGLSDILSKTISMPDWISYSKIRVSYSEVGNSIQSYISTQPVQYPEANDILSLNPIQPLVTLKPERTKSFEAGTEWRFFNDHLTFDATFYKTNTYNQLFTVTSSHATGYSGYYLNAGNVQNEGFEGTLGYNGNIAHDLSWNTTVTFSLNRNKIISLYTDNSTGVPNVITRLQLPSAFDSYSLEVRQGKPYGEIYARDFLRDANGNIEVSNGKPVLQDSNPADYTDVGNSNPNFLMGWNNTFRYKNIDLEFLIDGRFGGEVVDMTEAYLDYYGDSQASATARDNGGVTIGGQHFTAQNYYTTIGSRQGALAQYAYSATNVRLREASLGYTIPGKLFNDKIKDIRVAFTARNLFFFYLKAPYDPDVTLSTDNGLQGIDLFGQPSVRSFGFNVSARF
ncbi:MAG TPA: SusC/RagA family TonB-linked outer membrane protein [Mucilaginibacter sp.]|nr:SusC/RagA family TonB-linked outer membrane protein [Mucilaginibacter sp.]